MCNLYSEGRSGAEIRDLARALIDHAGNSGPNQYISKRLDAREAWINVPWEVARDLQKPTPAGALQIVAAGAKEDPA